MLNSKLEFGAYNLTEVGVKRGNFLAGETGKRKEKKQRKRRKQLRER